MSRLLLFSVPPHDESAAQATGPVARQGVRYAELVPGGGVIDENTGRTFSGPTQWIEWLRTPQGSE